MAENFQGFVTPEQQFQQLYSLSDKTDRNRRLKIIEQQKQDAKRSASDKFFVNYLDPNERFTGTNFDPVNAKLLGDALNQAFEMSKRGLSDNEILMAISPLVNKVTQYTQKAKALSAQKKQAIEVLSKQKGIDPLKFSEAFDKTVFMETDPDTGKERMRDINLIDPSQNYSDAVLKEGDIFTPEAFDEYVSKSGKSTRVEDISVYNPNRSMRRTKAEMTAPSFMISETDERGAHVGFVPKYNVATDGENVLMHKFLGDDGKEVEAPVRMVTDDVFNDLPPTAKGYIRQEVRRFAKQNNVPMSSAQAENFAKALAYDQLKTSGKQFSTFKEMQVQKAAPAPRISVRVSAGSSSKDSEIRDIYKEISEKGSMNERVERNKGVPLNELTATAQKVVLKYANELTGDNLTQADIYVKKEKDGTINILRADDNSIIAPIDFDDANFGVQPGVKEKREVVEKSKLSQSASKYTIKGKTYSESELLKMGYTLDQINPYKNK